MISRGMCPSIKRNQPCYAHVTVSDEFLGTNGFETFKERIESTGGLYLYKGKYPQVDKDLLAVYGEQKIYSYETILLLDGDLNRALESMVASDKTVNPLPDENGLYAFKGKTYQTYELALSEFCKQKSKYWQRLITEREGNVPDFVIEAMKCFDVYKWNDLDMNHNN